MDISSIKLVSSGIIALGGLFSLYSKPFDPIGAGVNGGVVVVCSRLFRDVLCGSRNKNQISKIFKSRHFSSIIAGGIVLMKGLLEKNSLRSKIITLVISISSAYLIDYFLDWIESAEKSKRVSKKIVASIPEKWEDDKIFQQFVCAISQYPTLNPAGDPNATNGIYDKFKLGLWVYKNGTSPLTRQRMCLWDIRVIESVKSLLHYRLRQLEEYEKTLDGELLPKTNSEHLKWVENSACELNNEIKSFLDLNKTELKDKFDKLKEIPPFLIEQNRDWRWTCSDTGKLMLHPVRPKLDAALLKNSKLARIRYEQSRIDELLNTSQLPKDWPITIISFSKDNLVEDSWIRSEIKEQFIIDINELKNYYTPFDPLEDKQNSVQDEKIIEINELKEDEINVNEDKDI